MKRFLALILLLLPASAWATTTVSGALQNLGTIPVGQNAFVRFWLRGCSGNQPRVNGTAVIASSSGGVFFFDLVANVSGYVTGTIYSTRDSTGLLAGEIECGGSKTAVWYGMQFFVGGKGGPEIPIHAKNNTTLDISNVTPLTTSPIVAAPTGDSTYCRLDGGNGSCPGTVGPAGAPGPRGSPTKPTRPGDPVQMVSPNGNDANDGLSWASAKMHVYNALQALPGGSSTFAGTGTVLLSGTVNYGGPVANQGMWLMGQSDPNFASPPSGWLKMNTYSPINIECVNANGGTNNGATCVMNGGGQADLVHPAVWLSAYAQGFRMKGISLQNYRNTYIKLGIDSNNNRSGTGAVSSVSLDGIGWNHGSCNLGGGPGIDIGSNSFWIWISNVLGSGCAFGNATIAAPATGLSRASGVVTVNTTAASNVTATGDGSIVTIQNASDPSFNGSFTVAAVNSSTQFTYTQAGPDATSGNGQVITYSAAAINIDPGATGDGSGLIFVDRFLFNQGGVRVRGGVNGGGLYVTNGTIESSPGMPGVLAIGNTITNLHVENVEIADSQVPVSGVRFDNNTSGAGVFSRIDAGIAGPGLTLGGSGELNGKIGQFGFANSGRITGGGIDQGRRLFALISVPSANLANTIPASWTLLGPRLTSSIADPSGGAGAGRITGTGSVYFYGIANDAPITVGDVYVYGVWARSQTASGWGGAVPVVFELNANGYGGGDTCTPTSGPVWPPVSSQNDQWSWVAGFCKIYTAPSHAGLSFRGGVNSTHTTEFFSPVVMKFASGTKSDNEIYEIVNNLAAFSSLCAQGQVCGIDNKVLNMAAYATLTNCSVNSVSPAACVAAPAGAFVVPTTTTTYTVNTTAVTAKSRI
ncbi:MAG TPA: hypothetical protein VG759_05455, partial [Candidatus Angelobacter sp.]|nr:hypothetical protein [Candidatus Angelobacter sp.]